MLDQVRVQVAHLLLRNLDLLERGIPVLCEKPLALDYASARKLVDESTNAGVPLTMAAKFRYVEDAVRAKSIVDAGDLGAALADELEVGPRESGKGSRLRFVKFIQE
jgi:predicted dehydrogenase